MRIHLSNMDAVAHAWAHQTQSRGEANNVSFDGDTYYSYGTPVAKIVYNEQGEQAYFVSTRSYSMSTSRHISTARSAIPRGAIVFHVHEAARGGWNHETRTHLDNLIHYKNEIDKMRQKARRARVNGDWYLSQAAALYEEAQQYAAFFGQGEVTDERFAALVEEKAAAILKAREEQMERERQRAEQQRVKMAAVRERWLNGEEAWEITYYPEPLLRIKPDDPTMVETSKSAEVPLRTVRRLYALATEPTRWPTLVGLRAGHYTVNEVSAERVVIGCHEFSWTELCRFAAAQGWDVVALPCQATA